MATEKQDLGGGCGTAPLTYDPIKRRTIGRCVLVGGPDSTITMNMDISGRPCSRCRFNPALKDPSALGDRETVRARALRYARAFGQDAASARDAMRGLREHVTKNADPQVYAGLKTLLQETLIAACERGLDPASARTVLREISADE